MNIFFICLSLKLYKSSNCKFMKRFMLFNIPTAQTIKVQHPTIPITPVIVLILFLIISLIFHLVEKGKCLNIPFVVIFKFLFFTFGSSFLNDSAGVVYQYLMIKKKSL